MQNPIIKNGVFAGLAGILLMLVLYLAAPSMMTSPWISLVSFAIIIIFMVMAVSNFKAQNNGFASFGEALLQSLGVAGVATIIGSIFSYLLYNVIDPGLVDVLKEASIAQIESMEGLIGEEGVDKALDDLENQEFTFGFGKILFGAISAMVIYLIISLIVAAITQKKPKGAASLDSHV